MTFDRYEAKPAAAEPAPAERRGGGGWKAAGTATGLAGRLKAGKDAASSTADPLSAAVDHAVDHAAGEPNPVGPTPCTHMAHTQQVSPT